ncbi:class I SAM-dependent methyltransferase [Sphingopyxis granuli]|uniref:Methyltransferase type 12 n=1 Tax=Sphingopyxis granuli TaxID=267128 RepID=A0AA86GNA4_9SPHN|nr:class I SAM-dependent methyltransferase [Sphingopyxis granuli]AMG75181.1 Methyltransferase type 12 [Sphingopyxis granuli]
MSSDMEAHWNRVYRQKGSNGVSWYQEKPTLSLAALDRFGARPTDALIDVGGGASSLVDHLLDRGWEDLSVLDLAQSSLDAARLRLGDRGEQIVWIRADITQWTPPRSYDVWHDRAVFHFLTEPAQRSAYKAALAQGLLPGGLVIMATFAPDGPEKCSGLPVVRYDAEGLQAELGDSFELLEDWREEHVTPWGDRQAFVWCVFRKRS